jgi:alpha-tubulin suppressor-like RCC1 family protein
VVLRGAITIGVVLCAGGCEKLLDLTQITQPPPDAAPDAPPPPSAWAAIAPGSDHSCGLHVDGSLWCWGRNDYGQLGATAPAESIAPVQITEVAGTWLSVTVRGENSCAIRDDQTLWCWGHNNRGQVGTGDFMPVTGLHKITAGSGTWVAVSNGVFATYAIDTAHHLWAWGDEYTGELGDGVNASADMIVGPTPIAPSQTWQSVSGGEVFACALDTGGNAWCWGDGGYSELGNPVANNPQVVPLQVSGTDTWTQLVTGARFVCALRVGGGARCWGADADGELGDDLTTTTNAHEVVGTDLITDWVELAAGDHHACGRRPNGEVSCWGANYHGQLAVDTSPYPRKGQPTKVTAGASPWLSLAAGGDGTCAIDGQHMVWCAGRTGFGQLGTLGSHTVPTPISGTTTWSDVAGGWIATCAIDATTSAVSCWGSNFHDVLGDGTGLDHQVPQPVSGSGTYSGIAVGLAACEIDSAGSLNCWGHNNEREVGDTTTNDVPLPKRVTAYAYSHLATGTHTCGIVTGSIVCWGQNSGGECGQPMSGALDPTAPTNSSWNAIAVGDDFTCAIDTSQNVQCFGFGGMGELGNGMVASSYTPVLVTGGANADEVVTGAYHACARSGTAVYCWGLNDVGQLGDQSTVSHGAPVTVMGSWKQLAAGYTFTCGLQTNDTLWCWGSNQFGQLGDGTFIDHHEPTQVGTATWKSVRAGRFHVCARANDDSLSCWGRNDDGQLGDGTAWRLDLVALP